VLTGTPSAGDEPADEYTYDPMDPVDIAVDEMGWMLAETLQDRARLAERPDVLVYETAPLEGEVEITGPISVTLFAASSAPDTDFTAALVDVFPDGYAHLIQEGIIRASYRNSEREPSPIEPERVYEYSIDLWATSYVVNAGHRIRVEISSSNFNFYDRNPNTGEPFGTATTPVPAQQRVLHTSQYPSRITLPILVR
jgi:putative CocE/NonD family hydrolase